MTVFAFPSHLVARTGLPAPLWSDESAAGPWPEERDRLDRDAPAPWEDRVDLLARTNPDVLDGPPPRPLAFLFTALTQWIAARNTSGATPEGGHVTRGIDPVRSLHAG